MKFIFTVSIALCVVAFVAKAQDATWVKNVYHEVGLDSTVGGARVLNVDVNNDNYPDLVWGTGNGGKNKFYLYLNIPNPDATSPNKRIYKDFTAESGMNVNRTPGNPARIIDVAALADIDNDGDVDLVTSIYYHRWEYYNTPALDPGDRSEVMLNDGAGHFTLVQNNGLYNLDLPQFMTKALTNTTGMSLFDYDADGKLDVYMSQWFRDYANDSKMKDILMKGKGDGTFEYVQNGGINVVEPMYGMNVTDWNNDGLPDVITSGYCRSGGSLFVNKGDGTFADVAPLANYSGQLLGGDHGQNLCQWEAQPADFDNDGDMDLLQVEVHGGYDAGEGRTHVSVNQGAEKNYRYEWELDRVRRDAPLDSHLGDQGGQWFDLDNDGLQDIAIGQMAYPQANLAGQERIYILKQNKDGNFDDISKALGIFATEKEGHSMEPVDFDMDGDQDLMFSRQVRPATGNPYMQVMLLRNDIGNKNNFIAVKVNPPAGVNRNAIGTRITVHTGAMHQIREITAGGGHFAGQQHFIQLFGLGKYEHVDSVTIRWPRKDNNTVTFRQLPANVTVRIDSNAKWNIMPIPVADRSIIALNKPAISAGIVDTGKSADAAAEIINYGNTPLIITSLTLTDANKGYELLNVPALPTTIAPGMSVTLTVRFQPHSRKEYRAAIVVASNAGNQPLKTVPVIGFGNAPKPIIALSAPRVGFDTAWLNVQRSATFSVSSTGEQALTITGITPANNQDGAFSIAPAQFPVTLQPNQELEFTLNFTAKSRKKYTDTLRIVSNAHNDTINAIAIYGNVTGPNPKISINGTLFFPKTDVGKSSPKDIVIGNTGDYTLTVSNMTPKDFTDVFTLPSGTVPLEIPAGGEKIITVSFAPKELGKTYSTQMTVESDAVDNPSTTITLRGVASDATSVEWDEQIAGVRPVQIHAYPQPAAQSATVKLTLDAKNPVRLRVTLIDALGRAVTTLYEKESAEAGEYMLTLDVSSFAAGNYRILAEAGGVLAHIPLTVVR